jgi:diguanylate cyclase (GGDEF)-like protein
MRMMLVYIRQHTYVERIMSDTVYNPHDITLNGREMLEIRLEICCEQAQAELLPTTLALIDVDFMGRINAEAEAAEDGDDDESPEEKCDALLWRISERLQVGLGDDERIFRYGGDCFAIVSPGMEKEAAFLRIEELRIALSQQPDLQGVTVSAGVAATPDDAAKGRDLINKASEALYRAKVTGRNKVCLAREEKMAMKSSYYQQGQLLGLRRLAEREGIGEAMLLREALNDLLRKYNK